MLTKEQKEAQKRLDRLNKIQDFEQKVLKANIEFSKQPWWVQQQELADYHYNDFDLEQEAR